MPEVNGRGWAIKKQPSALNTPPSLLMSTMTNHPPVAPPSSAIDTFRDCPPPPVAKWERGGQLRQQPVAGATMTKQTQLDATTPASDTTMADYLAQPRPSSTTKPTASTTTQSFEPGTEPPSRKVTVVLSTATEAKSSHRTPLKVDILAGPCHAATPTMGAAHAAMRRPRTLI
jgi:hypothetical protein